ncbi:MAG: hypothetical protein ACRC0G_13300, partial [Fusobacteriaceae bacterium]
MKKIVILFIFFCQIALSRQLVTNGEILFYYDDKRNLILDIKGSIFSEIDISQIDIGTIINGEHYYLRDFIESNYVDKNKKSIEVLSKIDEIQLKTTYSFINQNQFLIKTVLVGDKDIKKDIKISYNLFPKKDNGYLELVEKGKYIYNKKISFEDSTNRGAIYFSKDPIQKGTRYFLSEVTEREINYSDKYIYYIVDFEESESNLILKFGTNINQEIKDEIYIMQPDDYREIEKQQLNQLKLFISRAVVPSEISQNIPKADYINELNLRYIGSYYGISYIKDILEKQRPKTLERIYYDFIIFKIIEENPNLRERGQDFYNYVQKYIDTIFEEVYNEGDITEIFYLYKLLGSLEKYSITESNEFEKFRKYRANILKLVDEKFYDKTGIKNNRYSKIGEAKNLIYSELINQD